MAIGHWAVTGRHDCLLCSLFLWASLPVTDLNPAGVFLTKDAPFQKEWIRGAHTNAVLLLDIKGLEKGS